MFIKHTQKALWSVLSGAVIYLYLNTKHALKRHRMRSKAMSNILLLSYQRRLLFLPFKAASSDGTGVSSDSAK